MHPEQRYGRLNRKASACLPAMSNGVSVSEDVRGSPKGNTDAPGGEIPSVHFTDTQEAIYLAGQVWVDPIVVHVCRNKVPLGLDWRPLHRGNLTGSVQGPRAIGYCAGAGEVRLCYPVVIACLGTRGVSTAQLSGGTFSRNISWDILRDVEYCAIDVRSWASSMLFRFLDFSRGDALPPE